MKTLSLILGLSTFLIACDLSFETKLIDEPLANTEYPNNSENPNVAKSNIKGITKNKAWFLEVESKRKLKAIFPFQNIVIIDSINSYFVISVDDQKVLLKKSEVILNTSTKVVLDNLAIYSVPDLTKKSTRNFTAGNILMIQSKSLGDFYYVKKSNEKKWSFVRKEDSKLSDISKDLEIAYQIEQIQQETHNPFIQAKLFEELSQSEGFNRSEWLPSNENQTDFRPDDDIL